MCVLPVMFGILEGYLWERDSLLAWPVIRKASTTLLRRLSNGVGVAEEEGFTDKGKT